MKRKAKALVQGLSWQTMVKDYLFLTIGAISIAVNFHFFMAPAAMAPGGATGIALIINRFTGWSNGLILMGIAIPVLILGFRYLGRFRFLTRTLYLTVLSNVLIDLLERWLPPVGITDDLLLNALVGGIVGGIGYGIALRGRGTYAGTGGTIERWTVGESFDVPDLVALTTLEGHAEQITDLTISPDGSVLASADDAGQIKLWQIEDGALLAEIDSGSNPLNALEFSPDGQLLAGGGVDRMVRIWRLSDQRLLKTLTGFESAVFSLAFSPDGATLASGTQGAAVYLWSLAQ
jgi:hypothetical protein